MSMYDSHDDTDMKDQILRELIAKMEDVLGTGLKERHGMGVEVQAESPEGLKAGLEKAGEVVDKGPEASPIKSDSEQEESDESDLERLAELDDEDDKDKFKK